MGKVKKKRFGGAAARADPIGLGSEPSELEGLPNEAEFSILDDISQQIQSVNPEDRVCGCHSLSMHAAKKAVRDQAISAKMVRVVSPFLLDDDPNVCLAAAGALRNLSSYDTETTDAMVTQDVMTPLVESLKKSAATRLPQQNGDKSSKGKSLQTSLLIETINLLWNLIESSPTALNAFNRSELLDVVLSNIDPQLHKEVVLASLNTLAAASEDNPLVSERVGQPDCQQNLLNILQISTLPINIRTAACLVLVTACTDDSQLSSSMMAPVMSTLAEALQFNTREQISNLCASLANGQGDDEAEDAMEVDKTREDSLDTEKNTQFTELMERMKCLQTGLEILANLSTLGSGSDWEDVNSDEDESEEMENGATSNGDSHKGASMSPEMVEALAKHSLIGQVMANIEPVNIDASAGSNKAQEAVRSYEKIRATALICISNLSDGISMDDLGGPAAVHQLWVTLVPHSVQQKNDQLADEGFQEASSTCLRTLTSKLCEDAQAMKLLQLSKDSLTSLLQQAQNIKLTSVKINFISIVGDLAVLFAKTVGDSNSADLLCLLGGWLVGVAKAEEELGVVAEALDRTFDAFAEDETDPVFAKLELLPQLKSIHRNMQVRLTAQEKRRLGKETAGLVNMARLNLKRFIAYKEKRFKK